MGGLRIKQRLDDVFLQFFPMRKLGEPGRMLLDIVDGPDHASVGAALSVLPLKPSNGRLEIEIFLAELPVGGLPAPLVAG